MSITKHNVVLLSHYLVYYKKTKEIAFIYFQTQHITVGGKVVILDQIYLCSASLEYYL